METIESHRYHDILGINNIKIIKKVLQVLKGRVFFALTKHGSEAGCVTCMIGNLYNWSTNPIYAPPMPFLPTQSDSFHLGSKF